MHLAAALAIVLLLAGSAVASATQAPITEITAADCLPFLNRGPLVAYVLRPDGRALRATAPILPDGTAGSPSIESAYSGAAAYRVIVRQIEMSSFFERSRDRTSTITMHSRGMRISAVRGLRRVTWASDHNPADRHDLILSAINAVLVHIEDSRLAWRPSRANAHPFAICREPVQRDAFRN
jgi:hypothetical protein